MMMWGIYETSLDRCEVTGAAPSRSGRYGHRKASLPFSRLRSRTHFNTRAPSPLPTLVLAFLLPFTQLIQIQLVGRLYGQDLAGAALLLLLLLGSTASLARSKYFFLLLGLWLLGQILTDFYRGTPFEDYSRGWAKITFFGVSFAFVWLLAAGRMAVLAAHSLGLGLALIASVYLTPTPLMEAEPWKFGLAYGLLTICAIIVSFAGRRKLDRSYWGAAVIGAVAVLALLNNARAVFAIGALSSMFLVLATTVARRPGSSRSVTPAKFVLLVIAGFLAMQLLASIYGFAAEAGWMGEEGRDKYIQQSSGDVNILLGGRAESLVSLTAIWDAPLLGHGSWAKDLHYVRLYYEALADLGLPTHGGLENPAITELIPSHSHLLGAWVEAGLAGAIFWSWIIYLAFKALYRVLKTEKAPKAFIVVAAFTLLWNIPFSPFGAEVRFFTALQVALLLFVCRSARQAPRLSDLRQVPRDQHCRSRGASRIGIAERTEDSDIGYQQR